VSQDDLCLGGMEHEWRSLGTDKLGYEHQQCMRCETKRALAPPSNLGQRLDAAQADSVPISVTSQVALQSAVNLLSGANLLAGQLDEMARAGQFVSLNAISGAISAISTTARAWTEVAGMLAQREQQFYLPGSMP
jgi:hypothetical protein